MLSRYTMIRGKRPADDPLPEGIRKDTRYRTEHPLRPTEEMVAEYFANPGEVAWRKLRTAYLKLLEQRFKTDRAAFDEIAQQAHEQDVYLGCNCPTKKNPRVDRCHTYLALEFMKHKYPDLKVALPESE